MKSLIIMALAVMFAAVPQTEPTPDDFQILSDKTENGIRTIIIKPAPLICAKQIDVKVETATNKISDVKFYGGCPGNGKAVSSLLKGMTVLDVVTRLKGNTCGNRPTSCADQLVRGLKKCYKL